jgi:DNA anti-recombination protein RmuC
METTLSAILKKLDTIEQRIVNIEEEIHDIKQSSDNMNDHISFVESVYDTVKSPFYFIMNKIKTIEQLPTKESFQMIH